METTREGRVHSISSDMDRIIAGNVLALHLNILKQLESILRRNGNYYSTDLCGALWRFQRKLSGAGS